MRFHSCLAPGLGAALLAAGCGGGTRPAIPPVPAPPAFDPAALSGSNALAEVAQFLAVGPRDAGTAGAAMGANHIRQRLEALGVRADVDVFTNRTPRGDAVFRNVLGVLPGRGPRRVVLGAHYDTKSGIPGFVGANDSGSGVGLLLEIARLAAGRTNLPAMLELAFFDGEEAMVAYGKDDGFHGSRRHAALLRASGAYTNVAGVIVLDMIGDRDLKVTLPLNGSPTLASSVLAAAHAENVRDKFGLFYGTIGDDHDAFLNLDMPAVDLIDFAYGSKPGQNDYWHTAEDTLDKLDAASLQLVGRVTLRVVNELMAGSEKESSP